MCRDCSTELDLIYYNQWKDEIKIMNDNKSWERTSRWRYRMVWCIVFLCITDVLKVMHPFKEHILTDGEPGVTQRRNICKELMWWTPSLRGCMFASLPLAWCHSMLHHFHYSLLQQLTGRDARRRLFPRKRWMSNAIFLWRPGFILSLITKELLWTHQQAKKI